MIEVTHGVTDVKMLLNPRYVRHVELDPDEGSLCITMHGAGRLVKVNRDEADRVWRELASCAPSHVEEKKGE